MAVYLLWTVKLLVEMPLLYVDFISIKITQYSSIALMFM